MRRVWIRGVYPRAVVPPPPKSSGVYMKGVCAQTGLSRGLFQCVGESQRPCVCGWAAAVMGGSPAHGVLMGRVGSTPREAGVRVQVRVGVGAGGGRRRPGGGGLGDPAALQRLCAPPRAPQRLPRGPDQLAGADSASAPALALRPCVCARAHALELGCATPWARVAPPLCALCRLQLLLRNPLRRRSVLVGWGWGGAKP